MGYESKLIVAMEPEVGSVIKDEIEGETYHYARVLATFDLCKVLGSSEDSSELGRRVRFRRHNPYTPRRFMLNETFVIDQQEAEAIYSEATGKILPLKNRVYEDSYGDPLVSLSIEETLQAVQMDYREEFYRRLPPVIAVLDMIQRQREGGYWKGEHLFVLHYGY